MFRRALPVVGLLFAMASEAGGPPPEPDPFAPPPVPTLAELPTDSYARLLLIYMAYVDRFHGTTHTDGWNLDEMKVSGEDRDALSKIGRIVEAAPAQAARPCAPVPARASLSTTGDDPC